MLQSNPSPQPEGPMQPGSSLVPVHQDVTAEYHLKMGKNLYHSYLARSRQQDLDAAIQHFQKAVEIEPNMAEAYIQLASALWDQGTINLELAQFYCQTALKLDPKQADANLFLGYFLQRAGFLDDAIQEYKTAIRKKPLRSARARIALGNALLKQSLNIHTPWNQFALATQGIMQFLGGCTVLPFDKQTCGLLTEALIMDAQVYALTGLAKVSKKLRLQGLAQAAYSLGAHLMPREPLFFHLLGDEHFYDTQNRSQAIEHYRQALLLDPKNLNLMKKLGKAYAQNKDIPNAVETLNQVIEVDADDFDTLYQLGQIHTEEQAYFKALYYYKEAERLQPLYPYLHSNIAFLLFKLEDMEGAFEEYKIAMEYGTDPEWLSTVSQTLGTMSYQIFNDPGQALDYFQQSLHYNPENAETMAMLADLYFESGHLDSALTAYQTLLQMMPDNTDCYSNIGYILWQLDRNDEAIDAYLTAIHFDQTNHIAHNNLGVIYLDEQSDPAKALPLFQKAYNLKSDYTLACFNIGRALQSMGRNLDAAEYYTQALEINQNNPELEDGEIQSYIDRLFD